jgi:hypothetical protein
MRGFRCRKSSTFRSCSEKRREEEGMGVGCSDSTYSVLLLRHSNQVVFARGLLLWVLEVGATEMGRPVSLGSLYIYIYIETGRYY